jgi:septal ring factor EnvC (AmiA/AmiB activator)
MMTVYVAKGGKMSLVDPAHEALYARLEEVLGADHAATLMTHLPPTPAGRLATFDDIGVLSRSVDDRFAWVDQRFDRVDERFARVDERFDRVEERFARVDERFDRMDERFDRLEKRFDKMDDRFHDLQGAIRDQMRFYSGTTVAAMTALTAMFSFVVVLIT